VDYSEYLARKEVVAEAMGIEAGELKPHLFPYQQDLVRWALRRGRAALFADTGLGKTTMFLEWARWVCIETGGRVLVLTPLAVAAQVVREAGRFGYDAVYLREDDGSSPVVVTNYEMLDRFDPSDFAGIVLDESSILKAYTGKTRTLIIESFQQTPYRLACTATPAPNDHTELGNHSEFLGVKSRVEMLAEYFVHDGGSVQNWRLKGHAETIFWRWVCSWAAVVRMPSDLGYPDDAFALPDLRMHEHVIPIEHRDAWGEGYLFAPDVRTLSDQRATRRATMGKRVSQAAILAASDEPTIVWCELNAEADAASKEIRDAVQIAGSDSPESKAERMLGFADGDIRCLVTKPSIAGFGMNWQHCARMIFIGASHSYEQTYQAIRRCWRFGQPKPVDVHVIRAETEGAIVANYRRKERAHAALIDGMLVHMRDIQQREVLGARREWNPYDPNQPMIVPEWMGTEEGL